MASQKVIDKFWDGVDEEQASTSELLDIRTSALAELLEWMSDDTLEAFLNRPE